MGLKGYHAILFFLFIETKLFKYLKEDVKVGAEKKCIE